MSEQVEPIILRNAAGQPTHAVLPWDRYVELTGGTDEDAEDAADLERARVTDDGFRLPLEQVARLTSGDNVVKVLREWRGLSQAELAGRMGTEHNYISQIETGARRGVRKVQAFAEALGVPVEIVKGRL